MNLSTGREFELVDKVTGILDQLNPIGIQLILVDAHQEWEDAFHTQGSLYEELDRYEVTAEQGSMEYIRQSQKHDKLISDYRETCLMVTQWSMLIDTIGAFQKDTFAKEMLAEVKI